uniref:EamA domain-containing protein n=1 Tax=Zooxanthella nutricula TaxID=1333877 RepID=A0A6U6JN63_9DINO
MAPALGLSTAVALLLTSGVFFTAGLSLVKVVKAQGWPELVIQGSGYAVSAVGIGVFIAARGLGLPPRGQRRWVLACGGFMAASLSCLIVAMSAGAPLGDVSALVSMNVVLAALLGRVLLGESLRGVHTISVFCSIAGSLLISRPKIIFGGGAAVGDPDVPSTAWVGYVIAPVGGLLEACTLICARKCRGASEWHIAFALYAEGSLMLWALALLPGMQPQPFARPAAAPAEALGWVAAMTSLDLPSMVLYSVGAMAMPAAMTATVGTANRMIMGFVAEGLLFGTPIHPLTGAGAACMLVGVAIMAFFKGESVVTTAPDAACEAGQPEADVPMDDDVSSVASFAAMEFVGIEAQTRDVRHAVQRLRSRFQRRKAPAKEAIGQQVIGAAGVSGGA